MSLHFSGRERNYKLIAQRSCALASLALVLFTAACDGIDKNKTETPDLSKFSGLYAGYLKSCGECHKPGTVVYTTQVLNLDMSSEAAAYTSLTSVANIPAWAGAGCQSVKYVEPSSSARSVLYAILDADTSDAFADGLCKPLKHTRSDGGEANDPTAEQKQKIKEWIDKGAQRN